MAPVNGRGTHIEGQNHRLCAEGQREFTQGVQRAPASTQRQKSTTGLFMPSTADMGSANYLSISEWDAELLELGCSVLTFPCCRICWMHPSRRTCKCASPLSEHRSAQNEAVGCWRVLYFLTW